MPGSRFSSCGTFAEELDAAEVLTWIAFREAISFSRWLKEVYQFPFEWSWSLIELYDGQPERGWAPGITPQYLLHLLTTDLDKWDQLSHDQSEAIHRVQGDWNESELTDVLTNVIATIAMKNSELKVASADLHNRLRRGQVHAVGRQFCPSQTYRRSIEPREWLIGISARANGEAREKGGLTVWEDLLFDASQVIAIWPASSEARPIRNGLKTIKSNAEEEAMHVWALDFAKNVVATSRVPKRQEVSDALIMEFKCTTRVARAIYQRLPFPKYRNPPPKERQKFPKPCR